MNSSSLHSKYFMNSKELIEGWISILLLKILVKVNKYLLWITNSKGAYPISVLTNTTPATRLSALTKTYLPTKTSASIIWLSGTKIIEKPIIIILKVWNKAI